MQSNALGTADVHVLVANEDPDVWTTSRAQEWKSDSGVKYVEGNGLADRSFACSAELEQHLTAQPRSTSVHDQGSSPHARGASSFARTF